MVGMGEIRKGEKRLPMDLEDGDARADAVEVVPAPARSLNSLYVLRQESCDGWIETASLAHTRGISRVEIALAHKASEGGWPYLREGRLVLLGLELEGLELRLDVDCVRTCVGDWGGG